MFVRTLGLFAFEKTAELELDSVLWAPTEQGRHRRFDLGVVEQRRTLAPMFVTDNNRLVVALVVDVALAFDLGLALSLAFAG